MRVSQAIGRVLVDGGIEAFFGLAGSGNFAVLFLLSLASVSSLLSSLVLRRSERPKRGGRRVLLLPPRVRRGHDGGRLRPRL